MSESRKPNQYAYCTFRYITAAVSTGVLFFLGVLLYRSFPQEPLWYLGAWGGVLLLPNILRWVLLPIEYKKEKYIIKEDRIISMGGSILSSHEQELLIQNITHIDLDLPFLEHRFCKTGSIHLHSAGGEGVEVHMVSIDNPEETYNELLGLLERNGFSVSCGTLIREEKPNPTAVMLDTFFVGAILFGFLGFPLLGLLGVAFDQQTKMVVGPELILLCVLWISLLGWLVYWIHGTSLNQTFKLYEDATTSETNFLMYQRTLIPMKNLSDSSLEQGLVSRFLGIHSVSMSCQGSGSEITLSHINQGEDWKEDLDALLEARAEKRAADKRAKKEASAPTQGFSGSKSKPEVERDETYTAEHKMDKRFLFIPAGIIGGLSLFLLLGGVGLMAATGMKQTNPPPLFVFGFFLVGAGGFGLFLSVMRFVFSYISYIANTFRIQPTGFESEFRFITSKKVIFNAEKVTGVIVKESIFDRIIGTCSVEFWSIGASDHLRFSHIKKDGELLDKIRAKAGIYEKSTSHDIYSEVTMSSYLQSNIPAYFVLGLVTSVLVAFSIYALVGLLLAWLIPFFLTKWYYTFNKLTLHDDQLCFRTGILVRTHTYVRYDDVKYISSMRYPFSPTGKLTFDVAGERVISTDNGEQRVSNRIHIGFVDDVRFCQRALDLLLSGQVTLRDLPALGNMLHQYQTEELATSQPHMPQLLLTRGFSLAFLHVAVAGGGLVLFTDLSVLPQIQAQLAKFAAGWLLLWVPFLVVAVDIFLIAMLVLTIKAIRYSIDSQKVIREWGVFFKHHQAIRFEDIDYIGKNQGALNKMFGTGNITVNTIGSGETDMTLGDLKDDKRFYDLLKERYQGEEQEPS